MIDTAQDREQELALAEAYLICRNNIFWQFFIAEIKRKEEVFPPAAHPGSSLGGSMPSARGNIGLPTARCFDRKFWGGERTWILAS